jgi:ABC-type branched-subunit amino acid transport system substrate-binding protein
LTEEEADMNRTMRIACAAALVLLSRVSGAQDAYVVGWTAAMTGPQAGILAPVVEMAGAYVNHINGRGGINGKPVRLIVQDDQGEPSRAAANAKRLIGQDKVTLMLITSVSSTFAPVVAETKRAGVPLYFAGAVCPKETLPPADPLQFCSTAFGATLDSQAALAFIGKHSKEPVRLGLAAMAIPISRGEIDYAEGLPRSSA